MTETFISLTEGFTRRDFTVAEILKLQDLGIIGEDDKFELVEGEIVPMQSKSHRHELIKTALNIAIVRALPDHLWMGVESSMYLSERTVLEPDLVVYRRGIELEQVKGTDIILAVEVALTTLGFDLGRKAELYAGYGVQELWVIDAARRRTHVHPQRQGWAVGIDRHAVGEGQPHPSGPARDVGEARLDLTPARPVT